MGTRTIVPQGPVLPESEDFGLLSLRVMDGEGAIVWAGEKLAARKALATRVLRKGLLEKQVGRLAGTVIYMRL
jgi:hypothetical protein